jgi:hypothetical protein
MMIQDTKPGDDWEPDEDAWDEDDDGLVPCPYCREEILEDSPRCPSCGRYISEEDTPPRQKPLWLLATIAICLIMALMWLVEM